MNRYRNDLLAAAQLNQVRIDRQKERRAQLRADAEIIFAVCAIVLSAYLIAEFVLQAAEALA